MFKFENVNLLAAMMIYLGFFCLIGTSIYITKSNIPLLFLLCLPTIKTSNGNTIK